MERSGFIASLEDVEWRDSGNSRDFTFTGRAVVFDSWSEPLATPLGTFRERIMPGAFANVLAREPDVRLLFNHDESLVLARTKSGTLELKEEDDALHVWARVAPTSYAKDLKIVMARGDVDQMSFAFGMDDNSEDRWYEDEDSGEIRRDIVRVSDLFDVSPVTFPAYVDTTATMREIRSAVDAGKLVVPGTLTLGGAVAFYGNTSATSSSSLTIAAPETVGGESGFASASAETDPAVGEQRDASAEAETDPPVSGEALDDLREWSKDISRGERESYLRLLKEITRKRG